MRANPIEPSRDNPFDLTKASDYSDEQVKEYWVDIPDDQKSLVSFIKPTSRVPMFLLGGKGSGKTHLMRYCSSSVQELRHNGSLRDAILREHYIGTYASADGLNVHRFAGKGQSDDTWLAVFSYSFELWLATALLSALKPALARDELLSEIWQQKFIGAILPIFQVQPAQAPSDFDSLLRLLATLRAEVDVAVNNSAITRQLSNIKITFNPGDLIFGIPRVLAECSSALEKLLFVYLVDEVENLTEQQQRFLNTLIRYRKGNVTFRIGARLYGIKTDATLGSGEPIKRDAEYESLSLDAHLREDEKRYAGLVARLVLKRLEAAQIANSLDERSLPSAFAEVSPENYHQRAALDIVKVRDATGSERPHVARLRKALSGILQNDEMVARIVSALELKEHPLLEKVNHLAFFKGLSKGADLTELARSIKADSEALMSKGASAAPKYHELYSHFSSDLLAQLYREYGRKPVYAGFKTLVQLSQGVPRNLLSLLKHIYRRSTFEGDEPFISGQISIDAQVQGIYDASEWFWEDAQPDEHGSLVRNAAEQLASLARSIRYSDSPSECDLCCFLVNPDELCADASRAIKMSENWSFLLRVKGSSGTKNDDRIAIKYQLNPMLAARWGISESRRGALELKKPLADALLRGDDLEAAKQAIADRTEDMYLPKLVRAALALQADDRQTGLFDGN